MFPPVAVRIDIPIPLPDSEMKLVLLAANKIFIFIFIHKHFILWYYFYNQFSCTIINIILQTRYIHFTLCKYKPLQIKVKFKYLQTRVKVGLFVPLVVLLFDSILCNMCSGSTSQSMVHNRHIESSMVPKLNGLDN